MSAPMPGTSDVVGEASAPPSATRKAVSAAALMNRILARWPGRAVAVRGAVLMRPLMR